MRSHFPHAISFAICSTLILTIITLSALSRSIERKSSPSALVSNAFDFYRPSWHTYDYERPDYEVGLTYGNMLGNRGLSGPLIVDTGDKAKFGPWTSPYIMKQSSRSMALHSSQEILENSASDGQNQQDRSHLSSDQRAESARCHGILHACANWMALHSTKMRIVLFKQGRWCTDDDLASKACYKDNLEVDKDVILEVPGEGKPLSDELWQLIRRSCPLIQDCPKPELYSSTEATSVYRQVNPIQALASAARDLGRATVRMRCCPA